MGVLAQWRLLGITLLTYRVYLKIDKKKIILILLAEKEAPAGKRERHQLREHPSSVQKQLADTQLIPLIKTFLQVHPKICSKKGGARLRRKSMDKEPW